MAQWREHVSTLSSQDYGYDQAGRLRTVQDAVHNQCETRSYGFDDASDRTSLTISDAADDGSCQNADAASTSKVLDYMVKND